MINKILWAGFLALVACKNGTPSAARVRSEAGEDVTTVPEGSTTLAAGMADDQGGDRALFPDTEAVFEVYLGRLPTFAELDKYRAGSRADAIDKVAAAVTGGDAELTREFTDVFAERLAGFARGSEAALAIVARADAPRGDLDPPGDAIALADDVPDPAAALATTLNGRRPHASVMCTAEAPACFGEWLASWIGATEVAAGNTYAEVVRALALTY